jgi:hypothetical protein
MFSIRFKDEATADALVVTHGKRALGQEDILAVLDGEPPVIPLADDAAWPVGSTQLAKLLEQMERRAVTLVGPRFDYALVRRKIERVNAQIAELDRRRVALWMEEMEVLGY